MSERPKLKKKGKKGKQGALVVTRIIRLSRDHVLQVHAATAGGDIAAGERLLRLLKPDLSPDDLNELAWRISDPAKYGGISTGTDPELGEYADIRLTR